MTVNSGYGVEKTAKVMHFSQYKMICLRIVSSASNFGTRVSVKQSNTCNFFNTVRGGGNFCSSKLSIAVKLSYSYNYGTEKDLTLGGKLT